MKISPAKIDEAARAIARSNEAPWETMSSYGRKTYIKYARAADIAFGLEIDDD